MRDRAMYSSISIRNFRGIASLEASKKDSAASASLIVQAATTRARRPSSRKRLLLLGRSDSTPILPSGDSGDPGNCARPAVGSTAFNTEEVWRPLFHDLDTARNPRRRSVDTVGRKQQRGDRAEDRSPRQAGRCSVDRLRTNTPSSMKAPRRLRRSASRGRIVRCLSRPGPALEGRRQGIRPQHRCNLSARPPVDQGHS